MESKKKAVILTIIFIASSVLFIFTSSLSSKYRSYVHESVDEIKSNDEQLNKAYNEMYDKANILECYNGKIYNIMEDNKWNNYMRMEN